MRFKMFEIEISTMFRNNAKGLRLLFTFILAILLVVVCCSSGKSAEIEEATRVPVRINIHPNRLDTLTVHERTSLEHLIRIIEGNMTKWKQFPLTLPDTLFDRNTTIRFADFFQIPDNKELEALAKDELGRLRKLRSEEIESIRECGHFTVHSRKYPGHYHTWKVANWLQIGQKNIETSLQLETHKVLRGLKYDNYLKLPLNNIYKIFKGIREIISAWVGLVETHHTYIEDLPINIVHNECLNHLLSSGVLSLDINLLYNQTVVSSINYVMDRLMLDFSMEWRDREAAELSEILTKFIGSGLEGGDLQYSAQLQLETTRLQHFYSFLARSEELHKINPKVSTLLIERDKALRMQDKTEFKISNELKVYRQHLAASLKARYPLMGKITAWLQYKINEEVSQFTNQLFIQRYSELVTEMRLEDLSYDADILNQTLIFYSNEAKQRILELRQLKSETISEDVHIRILNSSKWGKVELGKTQSGEILYRPGKYNVSTIKSLELFWRLKLAWYRAMSLFKTFVHDIVVQKVYDVIAIMIY